MVVVTFIAGVLGGVAIVLVPYLRRAEVFDIVIAAVQGTAIALAVAFSASRMWSVTRFVTAISAAVRWSAMTYMQQRLKPGDTVWVAATIHPIAAPDASYYWYSIQDLIPMTLDYAARTPSSAAY